MIRDIPYLKCWIRREYLNNLEEGHGEYVEGYAFAVTAILNRPLLFTVHTVDGGVISRLPISALCHKRDAPVQSLSDLELWSVIGERIEVIEHEYLRNYWVQTRLPDGLTYDGKYLFTIDPQRGGFSESPDQHKTWNLIALDNGNFAAQPNNRCFFRDSHFVRFQGRPDYRTNTHEWKCEDHEWSAAHSDDVYYVDQERERR